MDQYSLLQNPRSCTAVLTPNTRGAAHLSRASKDPSIASLSAAADASRLASSNDHEPFRAAAAALDPERTTESLGYTWLTHWQLIEEDRQFRRIFLKTTRKRQLDRQQQLLDLIESTNGTALNSTTISTSGSDIDDTEIRIVHGRLSIVPSSQIDEIDDDTTSSDPLVDKRDSFQSPMDTPSSSLFPKGNGGTIYSSTTMNKGVDEDLYEDSEAVDDLTWLASHPEAEAADLSLEYTSSDLSNSTNYDSTTTQINDTSNNNRSNPLNVALNKNNKSTAVREPPYSSIGNDVASVLPGAVQLRLGNEVAIVRPLWISVRIDESSSIAALYESVVPLDAQVVAHMTTELTPFCSVTGLNFGALADLRYGPWVNYFIGLVGDVAPDEADILWPNQVLHRDRVMYNVRDAGDMARFLADPKKEDVEEHAENLQRLAQERGYKKGWCWRMLVSRWGKRVLKNFEIDV